MSIDARIASVMVRKDHVWLRLRPIQASDGTMSVAGADTLVIAPPYTRLPNAGQQIWGNFDVCPLPIPVDLETSAGKASKTGACIVEAGFGGGRIEYAREGHLLQEQP